MVETRLGKKAKSLLGILGLANALAFGSVEKANADGNLGVYNLLEGHSVSGVISLQTISKDLLISDGFDKFDVCAPLSIQGENGVYSLVDTQRLCVDKRTDYIPDKKFNLRLVFNGPLASNTLNSLRFVFPNSANTFDRKIIKVWETDASGNRIGNPQDVRQLIAINNGIMDVGTLTNGNYDVNIPYKNFALDVAPLDTSITNFEENVDGKVKLEGKARSGTVLWPEWSTNLIHWTSLSNRAKYVAVNATNFAGYNGFSYTNLAATNNSLFFRIGCDSYNAGTSNLLANSEEK